MIPFTDEQSRGLGNLGQHYDSWISYTRRLRALPYGMSWKTVAGKDYLYELRDRAGNGSSLGPRSTGNEAKLKAIQEEKKDLKERIASAWMRVEEVSGMCRALHVPLLNKHAAEALVQFDLNGTLGRAVRAASTNALA